MKHKTLALSFFVLGVFASALARQGAAPLASTHSGRRVEAYIKAFNADAAAKVTVRHLLDMTSGIGDFFGDRYEAADKERIRTLEDYLPLFADKPLEFEPGARNMYSNGGYIVLGLIVAKASARDYYAHIRDAVFKPAGMLETDWFDKGAPTADRAIGLTGSGPARTTNYATLPGRGSSAGGGYSTAADLLKFTVALGKGLFGAAAPDLQGGFGIAGGAPGLNAAVEYDPQRGYAIIVLANLDPPAATNLALQIRSWLPRETPGSLRRAHP